MMADCKFICMLKALGCVSLGLFLLLSAGVCKAEKPIEVALYGDDDYAPYSYLFQGEPKGIYVSLLQEIDRLMPGYSFRIELLPWRRLLNLAKYKEVFAVFPPYYRPEQRPYLVKYSLPLLSEKTSVFCRSDVMNSPRPKWPEDYRGLRIGNNQGFLLGGRQMQELVRSGEIVLDEAPGTRLNLVKLMEGRLDCYINDELVLYWGVKDITGAASLKSTGIKCGATVHREYGYLGYSAMETPWRNDFILRFDEAVRKVVQDGTAQKIVDEMLKNAACP